MAKIDSLPSATAADGTETVPIVQGPPGGRVTKRMPVQMLVAAAVKPTPSELASAIVAAIDPGSNIELVYDPDGGAIIRLKESPALTGTPTAPTAAKGTSSTQLATTAFVQAAFAYHYGSFAAANVQANELLLDHDVAEAHTLAANFAGCRVSLGTPPSAAWAASVLKNGVAIGSIAISTAGVVTLSTTGGAAVPVAVGDIITVQAPAVPNFTLARLRLTFRGSL